MRSLLMGLRIQVADYREEFAAVSFGWVTSDVVGEFSNYHSVDENVENISSEKSSDG